MGRSCRLQNEKWLARIEKAGPNYCQIELLCRDRNLMDARIIINRICVTNALKIRFVDSGFLLFFVARSGICLI